MSATILFMYGSEDEKTSPPLPSTHLPHHQASSLITHPLAFFSPHLHTQPKLRHLLCDISENVKLWFQELEQR